MLLFLYEYNIYIGQLHVVIPNDMKKYRWVQPLFEDVLRQIQLDTFPLNAQCSRSDGTHKAEGRYVVPFFSSDKHLGNLESILKSSRMSK